MRWQEIFESFGSIRHIEFDFDDGSVQGYVVETSAEQVTNWLEKHGTNDSKVELKIKEFDKVAFLNNINVDEEARGQGIGQDLLESFESEAKASGADIVVLISDVNESQVIGFDLTLWYKKNGFEILSNTTSGPLMIKRI